MRLASIIFATVLALCLALDESRAGDAADRVAVLAASEAAGALLYMDQSGWRQADRARRIALATDFMRIYCGNPAMPPLELVTCLDEARDSGLIFERALSCVASGAQGPKL